jgi:site-specific recombinase XerD
LFTHLVSAGYLQGNPLALMRRRRSAPASQSRTVERFLEQDLWQTVVDYIERLPRQTPRQVQHYERTRYLFTLLYLLGPRVSEVASHTMGSFVEIRGRWWWKAVGKGQRAERVPVNADMLSALCRYRQFNGLPPLPRPNETTPLVLSVTGRGGISSNMIYRLVKEVVIEAARTLEAAEPHKAAKLRQASTHWFRHTFVTHQADAGIELRYLTRNARHRKLETTAIYLHADDAEWHAEMERHQLKKKSTESD